MASAVDNHTSKMTDDKSISQPEIKVTLALLSLLRLWLYQMRCYPPLGRRYSGFCLPSCQCVTLSFGVGSVMANSDVFLAPESCCLSSSTYPVFINVSVKLGNF